MGMNSTFRTFVHSEVKTSLGFKLVEAYLSYQQLTEAASSINETSNPVEKHTGQRNLKNGTVITAEPDFTLDSTFMDVPQSDQNILEELHHTKEKHIKARDIKPPQQKRHAVYQVLTNFQPIGRSINSRF